VLHVVTSMSIGGIQTYLLNVLQHYDRARFHMDVCYTGATPGCHEREVLARASRLIPCRYSNALVPFVWRLARILAEGRYDAVCDFTGDFAAGSMWAGRLAGVPARIAFYRSSGIQFRPTFARRSVARCLHRRLIIAGNISTLPEERAFFDQEVAPRIDGTLVSYVGPVDDARKDALLGGAAAMLLPIEWEEPFPVVLPESLLCGTPVISFRRGGVPEGIAHGQTGFICDTVDDMCAAVSRLGGLSRAECRAEAERRFSDRAITQEYEGLYQRLLDSGGPRG